MNLEQFVQAQKFFDELRQKAIQEGGERGKVSVSPHNADRHFGTAAYAAALLYQRDVEELLKLEREQIVHPSTISGGSLISAMHSLQDYIVDQKGAFERDDYEQLARTCSSARRFLEKERG